MTTIRPASILSQPDRLQNDHHHSIAMKLRHLALATFAVTAAFAAPDESNLTLLDTENPAIRDLAVVAGDEFDDGGQRYLIYDLLNLHNQMGVFFSEGMERETLASNEDYINLLSPWEKKGKWTPEDFKHASQGPMFFTNDALDYAEGGIPLKAPCYQALPEGLPWRIQGFPTLSLRWSEGIGAMPIDFNARLNYMDPADHKVQLYKRFEFKENLDSSNKLDYTPDGSGDGGAYDTDRATLSATADNLVIVAHGWNTTPKTDPYTGGNWKILMKNIHNELINKQGFAPGWDLFAYRWGRDSYTGNLEGDDMWGIPEEINSHLNGGSGVGEENGTQAAEIGYQHGLVLGQRLWQRSLDSGKPLKKVHFIAHSAGTWLIRSASLYLDKMSGGSIVQQTTLLDPYMAHEGYLGWKSYSALLGGGEDSVLRKALVDAWASKVKPNHGENIFSHDTLTFGTNVTDYNPNYFTNRKIADSFTGALENEIEFGGHGGPIWFYAYTANPEAYLASTAPKEFSVWRSGFGAISKKRAWSKTQQGHAAVVGWEQSLFMQEVKERQRLLNAIHVVNSTFGCPAFPPASQSPSPPSPSGPQYGPPPPASLWQQILVDVDAVGWVRAMLLPANGGAAELAGPVRPEPDGSFAIELSDGTVLGGVFDTSVTPVAVTLTIDGVPFGQKVPKAQGTLANAGVDAQTNAAGNMVFSMVLADGTAGMAVEKDADNSGWEGAGVGTVDENGAFTVTGADGLQVTGQLLAGGGLDPLATTVAPPLVPEIHVLDAAGLSLTTGTAFIACGSVHHGGSSSALTITIKNTGTVDLIDMAVSIDGANAADFAVGALVTTSLAPDASTTLSVTFTPGAVGDRTARLRIASNDANENPFDIALTGRGFTATPLGSAGGGASGTLAPGAEDFYRVTVPGPGFLIVWSEGGTDTYGSLLSSGGAVLDEDNDSDLQTNFRTSAVVVAGDYFISVKGANEAIAGGYTVRSRFIAAEEPIQISFLERTADGVNLGFTNTAGVIYGIQASIDLKHWTTLDTVTGEGAEMLVPLAGLGGSPTAFFRVTGPLVAASFSAWTSDYFLTETNPDIIGPAADPDHDGLANAVEMVLGGNPATGLDPSLLPTIETITTDLGTGAADYFLFTYRRTDLSVAAGVRSCGEYCSDLSGPWIQAVDGTDGVEVVETDDFHGAGIDRVRVYVPRGTQARMFGRLKVTVP